MDGLLFASKGPKTYGQTGSGNLGHGSRVQNRSRQTIDKTRSSIFSSEKDSWQMRRSSLMSAEKNKHTFTLSHSSTPVTVLVAENVRGKSVNRSNYVYKSPISHDMHAPVEDVRSRNYPTNNRSMSAMAMLLNQNDTIKKLNREKSISPLKQMRPSSTFNSTTMNQCMGKGNPQAADSSEVKRADFRSKYIINSSVPMKSLKDLDTKAKFAAMRTISTVFNPNRKEASNFGQLKNVSPQKHQNSMNSLMKYDEGPMSKISSFDRKTDVQGKVSGQSSTEVKKNTRMRMGDAKTERVQDSSKQLYKTNVF